MKHYTLVKAHMIEGSGSRLICSYIYKTDSHALATHQCRKDFAAYDSRVILEASTIDIDDEKNAEMYRVHEECGCVMNVYGW